MSILSRGVPVTEANVFEPHHYRHLVDSPICDAGHTHPALPAPPMDARIESIESGHDDVGNGSAPVETKIVLTPRPAP